MDSTALAITLALFGVMLLVLSFRRHRHHRDVSALLHGISGALLLLGGSLLFTVALNFNTYSELRAGTPIAEVSIEKATENTYLLRLLRIPAGDLQVFSIRGEQWDLQARLLHWRGWTRKLGLSDHIRLEQLNSLSTRKVRNSSTQGYVNSYALTGDPGIDLWRLHQRYADQSRWLDTEALRTASLPLQDGARFHVYWQENQLVVRQINRPGQRRTPVVATPAVTLPDFMNELDRQTDSTKTGAAVGTADGNGSSAASSTLSTSSAGTSAISASHPAP